MPNRRQKSSTAKSLVLKGPIANLLIGPPALAFVPAFSLAAFWFGGEGALLVAAALVPAAYLIFGGIGAIADNIKTNPFDKNGVLARAAMVEKCDTIAAEADETGLLSCIHIIEIVSFPDLLERFGTEAGETVIARMAERLTGVMRDGDTIGQLGDARFAVCTSPVRQLSLELCIQMAGRLQTVAEEPYSIDGTVIYTDVCIGFCQHSLAPVNSSGEWLEAAHVALRSAQANGASSIRAYSDQMHQDRTIRRALNEDVVAALDSGEITPWFQPQLCTDTGRITGFEALARWTHPVRGVISPAEFLPAVEAANLLERLAEVMMYHSFRALKEWDAEGLVIPQVGVNFTSSDLSNPRLLEKIKWDLDRFELTPERLAVEVLETVIASNANDMITRNINALGKLGCRIDLDDFGTGNASISSIRRFSVSRIKIDRSFVMKADRDPEQQRMISAILTMAERLQVETLAEGVETVGEHVLLAQLGCDHVQGFGIARPMPFNQTIDWITKHNTKLRDVPQIMQTRQK
ncbi:putative bifunctional diguanylate cyclase/phosphodiesterase [Sulfitobacter guttiformis]|uniref:Diguanylate cyclase/phosphodiesterase n=1 Tax=Sulfitobacter guttiformis TaxID=74349 RepID=A0A420DQK6_9RHOB|nr:GGDEF domain-containing phosphodiesterase [Sulfitobacter guttiformis]KIN73827.1 Diguanylate cyclase [Sulfitobacter guttiformis KCTC 32187]RKE96460.1 diguanylate cyclase/phosphodiesterase [Sulfitobacter guttiformis]